MTIDQYLQLIDFKPTAKQREVLETIAQGRDVFFQHGRGAGSSMLATVVSGWFAANKVATNLIGRAVILRKIRDSVLPDELARFITVTPGGSEDIVRIRTGGNPNGNTRLPFIGICPSERHRIVAPLDGSELQSQDAIESYRDSLEPRKFEAMVYGRWEN